MKILLPVVLNLHMKQIRADVLNLIFFKKLPLYLTTQATIFCILHEQSTYTFTPLIQV